MRIADRGVDHKSLWIDRKSQQPQHARLSRERGEKNTVRSTRRREEGWALK